MRALGAMAAGSDNKLCCVPTAYRLQSGLQTRYRGLSLGEPVATLKLPRSA